MTNIIQTYQEAFRKNQATRSAVAAKTKVLSDISDSINYHLRSFLGFNFNIQIDSKHERYDPKGRVDINEWPSADELKALFKEWDEADTALRRAWEAIQPDDRVGLTPPPSQMSLS
jgi:hypothetical protein